MLRKQRVLVKCKPESFKTKIKCFEKRLLRFVHCAISVVVCNKSEDEALVETGGAYRGMLSITDMSKGLSNLFFWKEDPFNVIACSTL